MSERAQLSQLRQQLAKQFNEEELRTLCHDLGIDYDDLGGRGKSDNARELVAWCGRHQRLWELMAAVKRARPDVSWGALLPPPNFPFPRNPNFTRRAAWLDQLHHNLTAGETTAVTQAIAGLGGVGKTQLALEYCHRQRAAYDLIWWLRADEEATLAADMVQLGWELGLPVEQTQEQAAQVTRVRRWLERSGVRWLLVFDNADTIPPKQLPTYLPCTGHGRVLITSRNPNWGGVGRVLSLDVFTPDEAVVFLLERTGLERELELKEEARGLAEELGYLPLALEHAAAYVETTGCTLGEYERLLATQRARLWAAAEAPDAYHATITTTWELSFQQVRAKNPAAVALFDLCCFLAPEEIPLPLLRAHREALPEELAALLADELALNEAIGDLRRYSLLARAGEMLAVHRLVQTVARDRMGEERARKWAEAAIELIIAALLDGTRLHEWEAGRRILSHMIAAADLGLELAWDTERLAFLCNWIGYYLQFLADYAGARPYYERALAIREKALGPDHPDTALSLNNLGGLLRALGDHAGARPYYERALAINEKALGPDHPDTALSLNNLGYLLRALGDHAGARPYYERALAIREKALGPDHPDTALSLNNLGYLLYALGDHAGARPYYERALAINEKALGPDHPDTARSLNNLGGLLDALGDLAGARPYYERALAILEAKLGADHPHTNIVRRNLQSLS